MKKPMKKPKKGFEKIVVDKDSMDMKEQEHEAAEMAEKQAEDEALSEMVKEALKKMIMEKKSDKPTSLDELRQIRQQRHEEEMGEY